jgi:hypothetical protein
MTDISHISYSHNKISDKSFWTILAKISQSMKCHCPSGHGFFWRLELCKWIDVAELEILLSRETERTREGNGGSP